MRMTAMERGVVAVCIALAAFSLSAASLFVFWSLPLAQWIVESGFATWFANATDSLIAPLDVVEWQHRLKGVATRTTLASFAVIGIALCYSFRRRDWVVPRYLSEVDHPVQLAVTRIVVFATTLYVLYAVDPLKYCELPSGLTAAPFPWRKLFAGVSFAYRPTFVLYFMLVAACVGGLLGCFTRSCALVAFVVGVYVLGIPQSFGKVNHYHTAVWFPSVLIFSRAGDFFSIDSIWHAQSLARNGKVASFLPSPSYALPTRIIWLLLAGIYFYPGYYKIWGGTHDSILEWVFSDSLRLKIGFHSYIKDHSQWIRLDEYPRLCQCAGLAVVLWECSWPIIVLFPRLRVPLAMSTIAFHFVTGYVMSITFWPLRIAMLVLFPWQSLFGRLGRVLFTHPATVVFDPGNKRHVTYVNIMQAFNVLQRITIRAAAATEQNEHLRVQVDRGFRDGAAARKVIYRRLGLPVPLIPLIVCDWLALALGGSRSRFRLESPAIRDESGWPVSRPLVTIGALLVGLNCVAAVLHVHHAWPFAVFPTFENVMRDPFIHDLQINLVSQEGCEVTLARKQIKRAVPLSMWYAMSRDALDATTGEQQRDCLSELFEMLCRSEVVDRRQWSKVRFYDIVVDTTSGKSGQRPRQRTLLCETTLAGRNGIGSE